MPNDDLTDIKIALATLEQSNIATAEASRQNTKSHTELNIQIIELVGTIKESNVKYDLVIEGSVATANATSEALNKHLEYASPILLRSEKVQSNIDFMVKGIFNKIGWILVVFVALGASLYFGIDPSSIKVK